MRNQNTIISHCIAQQLLLSILLFIMFIGNAFPLSAQQIDATNKWAWSANAGWINLRNDTYGEVKVYNTHLEGYAWSESLGWIRMGTYTGGDAHTYENTTVTNYGVNNDGSGNLSGYAWSANAGWINFNTTSYGSITIDPSTGDFTGYVWSESVGWSKFNGQSQNLDTYKVNANWSTNIPVDLAVSNCTIATGDTCFDATNEITVSTVTVADNASANFIAGYSVTFLPGFHAVEGSYVHALITEDGSFCDAAGGSSIVSQPDVKSFDLDKNKEAPGINDEIQVKVYPNPNNGQFKVDISGTAEERSEIQVYNLQGKMVYSGSMDSQVTSEISIYNAIKGLYILKITTGNESFSRKISIQ
jgi:hypothetical protein